MTRDELYQVFRMPVEQLRAVSKCLVQRTESSTGRETVTGFCCLDGCDMDVYPFPSERDALLFSVLLKMSGYQPAHNIACSTCYKEYMSEHLQGGIEAYAE